jgi:hypothetical protein|tara:strand:- start:61 stop:810 length:750 start_codon:yes stop_codon:yes gene_type:complete
MSEHKFPSEVIDLPSEGRLYSKDHPCSNGKIEIKYMTAKEEDILTSQNLIKKGVVIDTLINSLIITEGVTSNDLLIGDKNAVMVAARILAYGPEYVCEIKDPNTGNDITQTFNLADCPFKKLPEGIKENKFEVELPVSKSKVVFKLLTGLEEKNIEDELNSQKKIGSDIVPELTTRLRHCITSVDGDDSQSTINSFSVNILARDSMHLRKQISKVSPDIELTQQVDIGGQPVKVDIPMTVGFFWPSTEG